MCSGVGGKHKLLVAEAKYAQLEALNEFTLIMLKNIRDCGRSHPRSHMPEFQIIQISLSTERLCREQYSHWTGLFD